MNTDTHFNSVPATPTNRPVRPHRFWAGPLLVLLALVASSCSGIKIQSQRSTGLAGVGAVHNMLVVPLDGRPEMCFEFEKAFVAQWKVAQVTATGNQGRFPQSDFKGDREVLRQKLLAAGVESVLLVRPTDRTTTMRGSGVAGTMAGGATSWSEVEDARYEAYTAGPSITTIQVVTGKLFRVSDGALLWNSSTQLTLGNDYSPDVMFRQLAVTIAGQLQQDKVF